MLRFAKEYKSIYEIFETYMHSSDYEDIDFVFDVVNYFRRKSKNKKSPLNIDELIAEIKHKSDSIAFFKEKLHNVFANKQKVILFTDAGLLNSVSFFKELRRRISRQLLPDQPSEENIQYVLNQLFYRPSDVKWVHQIPLDNWKELFDILAVSTFYEDSESKTTSKQILLAIMILSQRMGGLALQTDVRRMVPEYAHLNSPFIALDDELNNLARTLSKEDNPYLYIQDHELDYKQLNILVGQCEDFVNKADANTSKYGVSFSVNQTLLLIRQQIKRIKRLYNYLFIEKEADKCEKTIAFYLDMVKTNSKKNNIRKLIDDSVYNITYEITNYTGKTGEHYITSTTGEYFKMLKTALWGGVIVGFMCLVKLYMSMQPDQSDFFRALNYSFNYAIGFVLIYLTGSTLATKQPAMTASTIAKTLESLSDNDNNKEKQKHYTEFSALFTRLFRSQFIAFVGNVFGAFPVSMLLAIGMSYLSGYNIATKKSLHLLEDLNIWHTPVFLHACIAGVFLFLSGIIAGNVASVNNFNNFYYRLSEHPFLKGFFGKVRMQRVANWMQQKWPSVVSNIWFGVFMGSAWAIGHFFGLPIDIRHITFASGNLAYGLYGMNFIISLENILWCILGIGIIGLGNFIVSFGLSLWIALRSREVPASELKYLGRCVWRAFKTHPRAFFFPVKEKE
ncbi:putative site-specific recombinase [Capnocytophaga ochracea DSM 7271]|uniref:Putative site-specific recombinase n=1 Tax=Capnocytophaga ochracea (strain ATCC 27872 / DSM 7271 / CCUG 9716 / JCM 12966 / NCTC 12371 / SS31 / VPI 2845) TaxID=521097 RepID=C7M6G8_CAPOD|nr:recombinase [Capnocytophaga ochracea]ACU93034.1 putative site-specific recombinase [Capnocytophaga ochracea DSM 7271]UAK51733.1 site-specific recombinase [Capnocytophaga ochracea]